MNISPKLKHQLKLQNGLFYILLLIVTILLSQMALSTNHQADWTANNRNTLSNTTLTLLQQLDQTISIQVFISPTDEYADALKLLLSRYQHETDKLKVDYINPDFAPSLVREYKACRALKFFSCCMRSSAV